MKLVRYFCYMIVLTFTVLSCRSYYNDAIHWMDSIPKGTHISSVKKIQPAFIEIDWDNPDIIDSSKIYSVKNIKNNNDVLKMHHTLVFTHNKFVMRISKK